MNTYPPVVRNLLLLSMFCLALQVFRMAATHTLSYVFLPWNLLLAWVPLGLALCLNPASSKLKLIALLSSWLAFFPNAPYIITDMLHLRPRNNFPLWYDTVLVFAFAFTGFFSGMLSAVLVYQKLKPVTGLFLAKVFMWGCMLLAGYGIYLGRYLRWNTWDILLNPLSLFSDAAAHLLNPLHYPRVYGVTLVTGGLLLLAFMLFESVFKPSETPTGSGPS